MMLRYLSGTRNKCLCLRGENISIIGYRDFDYVGYSDNKKSVSGIYFSLWDGRCPYLGDLVSKSVLLCLLQKLSMLHLVRHVRKAYGFPN